MEQGNTRPVVFWLSLALFVALALGLIGYVLNGETARHLFGNTDACSQEFLMGAKSESQNDAGNNTPADTCKPGEFVKRADANTIAQRVNAQSLWRDVLLALGLLSIAWFLFNNYLRDEGVMRKLRQIEDRLGKLDVLSVEEFRQDIINIKADLTKINVNRMSDGLRLGEVAGKLEKFERALKDHEAITTKSHNVLVDRVTTVEKLKVTTATTGNCENCKHFYIFANTVVALALISAVLVGVVVAMFKT